MRASHLIHYFQPTTVSLMLLSVLALPALAQDAVLDQQRINLRTTLEVSHSLHLQFSAGLPHPLSMVSGDFDEDGVTDLVIGYGLGSGGSILLVGGNSDAITPKTQTSWQAAGRHEYVDAFLQRSKPIAVQTTPDLMIAADVNGDGHADLVYASKGSSLLHVKFGTGKGAFMPLAASFSVPGTITALASYRPGPPVLGEALVVGYESTRGPRLTILSDGAGGLSTKATYVLPAAAAMFAVENLDSDFIPDTAIVAGGKLLVLHGKNAINGRGRLETLSFDGVESVAAGDFLFDRHSGVQLSVLTNGGEILMLAHQGFDPRPYTSQELTQMRHNAQRHSHIAPPVQPDAGTGGAPWVEVERQSDPALHSFGSNAPILLRSRMSGGGDDLVVLNSSQQQRVVISHNFAPSRTASSPLARSSLARMVPSRTAVSSLPSGNVVGALSMRVNADGRSGLVILRDVDPSPEITVPHSANTFFVNTTADNTGTTTDPSDATRCSSGGGEACTLRDAITFANQDAADNISAGTSDTIMVPAGTYQLSWQAGTLDSNANGVTHLEILGPVTVMGDPAGTIIDGGAHDTIFTINPGPFGYYSALGDTSGTFLTFNTTLENLTIQNGVNQNNPANSLTGNFNNVGGCINWVANGAGDLTVNNSSVRNCKITWGAGGGIWGWNANGGGSGTLILSGDTISNNSTSEQGGGVFIAGGDGSSTDGSGGAAALSATNTTIQSNIASITINNSDPGGGIDLGDGGGISLNARPPSSGTPQTMLSGLTVDSNIADGDGGGIFTNSGIVLSTSLVTSNSAEVVSSTGDQYWGGGVYTDVASPEVGTTITSTNFQSNSAATAGGGILEGPETIAAGNLLTVSLSRFFGNTSAGDSNASSGLAVGFPGTTAAGQATATNNWWGCNAGPATPSDGCDQTKLYLGSGSMTVAPYAQFLLSASPATVALGSNIGLTITLNTNSSSVAIPGAFPAVATNYPYTFTLTGVTASTLPATGTFDAAGAGSAVFTPTSAGAGIVSAKFDGQTDSVDITVTATATSLAFSPASPSFSYGVPALITVQLSPSNATGITAADFTVQVDGLSALGGSSFGLTLISNNQYQLTGPFNLISPGSHTLIVSFTGTTGFQATSASVSLPVSPGNVTIDDTITPTRLIQRQSGTVQGTVAGTGTGATPTGTLGFSLDGATTIDAALVSGVASFTIPTIITTGPHSLKVTYSGDPNYASATRTITFAISGESQTNIASLSSTAATIDVFGFGFTAPSGQLSFTDVTSSSPVAAPVTLNTSTATTSLLPQVTTSTGANTLPDWTTLGDINGDGNQDLVTSLYSTDSVSVQLGNGDGTFQPATTILIAAGFGPAECHLVSLRGNGTLDLIVGSFNVNQIAVLLGNGNGTFEAPTFYTVGTATNTPTSLTAGDFNHDGKLDVAVANTADNTVSILLGGGTGSLTPPGSAIGVGHEPEAIRAGDFNDDGYSDLAVANYRDGTVTTLLNNQNGTFTATVHSVGSGAGSGPQALAIEGTGSSLQLAVANYKDNTVSVFKSAGDGTFGAQTIVNVGVGPDDLSFADFNGDGIQDLVVSNYTDGTVDLLLGSGGGSYSLIGPFKVGNKPYSAAVADLDSDGTPDLVVSNCFSNNTGVLLSGTQIAVPYSGLSLPSGNTLNAAYAPDGASSYGASTSANVTAP